MRFPQLHASLPQPPSGMPAELAALLHAGLDRDPGARPTAREFAQRLEPLVGALPVKARFGRRRRGQVRHSLRGSAAAERVPAL